MGKEILTIRDLFHKRITFTEIERFLIDTYLIQRLRHIKQEGTAYLTYPSANTSRFEHSIGVSFIASKILEILGKDLISYYDGKEIAKFFSVDFDKLKSLLGVVSIFHDSGHGPFSHVTERLIAHCLHAENKKRRKLGIKPHEYLSYKILDEGLPQLLDYADDKKLLVHTDKKIIEYIRENAKNVLTPKYIIKAPRKVKKSVDAKKFLVLNTISHRIFNSYLDADKLDYCIRDPHFTGTMFGGYDIQRIIGYLRILQDKFVLERRALSATESYVLERYKIYRWINSHHTICLTDELLARAIEFGLCAGIFEEKDFTYHHLNELITAQINNQIPNKIVDDHFILHKLRTEIGEPKMQSDLVLAKKYIYMMERRELYKPLWKTSEMLLPTEMSVIQAFAVKVKDEVKNNIYPNQNTIQEFESEFANSLRIEPSEVLVAVKTFDILPFEEEQEEIELYYPETGDIKHIKDSTSLIRILDRAKSVMGETFFTIPVYIYVPEKIRDKGVENLKRKAIQLMTSYAGK
jgi:HD superfamily phosphohydrolase